MSQVANLLVYYPTGAPYWEIDGIFYNASTLQPLTINRESRDLLISNRPIRLTQLAQLDLQTPFRGALVLAGSWIPERLAPPEDPSHQEKFVLLEAVGPNVYISPFTPRTRDSLALTAPMTNYTVLTLPGRVNVAINPSLHRVFQEIRERRRVRPDGDVPWSLEDFDIVGRQLQASGQIPETVRLLTPQGEPLYESYVDFSEERRRLQEQVRERNRIVYPDIVERERPPVETITPEVLADVLVALGTQRAAEHVINNRSSLEVSRALERLREQNPVFSRRLEAIVERQMGIFHMRGRTAETIRRAMQGRAGEIRQRILGGPETTEGREISFERATQMLQGGEITRSAVDPENQEGVRPGRTRVTLFNIDGREYDVIARYDPATETIYPPA